MSLPQGFHALCNRTSATVAGTPAKCEKSLSHSEKGHLDTSKPGNQLKRMNVLSAPFNQAVSPMFQFEDVFEHYLPKGGKK
jgi:hypothetical protein